MALVATILSALLMTQAHAGQKLDQKEIDYYNQMSAKCGSNLLCYYSPEEIQEALGATPAEALAKGLLDEDAMQRFADEDFGDTMAADPGEALVSRHRSAPRSRARRGSGGGAGSDAKHALVGYHQSSQPIWGPFIAMMKSCKPGCVPKDYNCHRDGAFSCHNFDRAIDVGAIACKGGKEVDYAIDRGPFQDLVSCARHKGLKVLYMQALRHNLTEDHHNHGHFSIGCMNGSIRWW